MTMQLGHVGPLVSILSERLMPETDRALADRDVHLTLFQNVTPVRDGSE